jgi:hypothetical protein
VGATCTSGSTDGPGADILVSFSPPVTSYSPHRKGFYVYVDITITGSGDDMV